MELMMDKTGSKGTPKPKPSFRVETGTPISRLYQPAGKSRPTPAKPGRKPKRTFPRRKGPPRSVMDEGSEHLAEIMRAGMDPDYERARTRSEKGTGKRRKTTARKRQKRKASDPTPPGKRSKPAARARGKRPRTQPKPSS